MTDSTRPSPGGNRGKGKDQTGRDHYSKPARVGGGFAVRFAFTDGAVVTEWLPRRPTRSELRAQVSAFEFYAAQQRFMQGGAQ